MISRITSGERESALRTPHWPRSIALGQLDFAFPREQGDGAHLAQVHAHRIVGLVAEILGELEFAEILGLFGLFLEIELRLFENFDAGTVEIGEQIFEFPSGRKISASNSFISS